MLYVCAVNVGVLSSFLVQREVLLLELSLFMVSHGNVQEAVDVMSRYSTTHP